MTHNAAHVILQALNTPVSSNGKQKLWHYVALACAIFYVAGYLVGKF